jgi:hypothetical protein
VDAIGADILLEIKGKSSRITSKSVLEFEGSGAWQWNWSRLGTLEAETDGRQMEALVDLTDLGINATGNIKVVFWTTDWEGETDATDAIEIKAPLPPIIVSVPGTYLDDAQQNGSDRIGILTDLRAKKDAHMNERISLGNDPIGIPEFELLLLPVLAIVLVFAVLRKRKK